MMMSMSMRIFWVRRRFEEFVGLPCACGGVYLRSNFLDIGL